MRKLSLFLSVIALIAILSGCGSGKVQTADLWELDDDKHIVIFLDWDAEQPFVEIIAPDGTKYDPERLDEEYVLANNESGGLMLRIMNGPAGQWKMRYDKRGNDSIDLSYVEIADDNGMFASSPAS